MCSISTDMHDTSSDRDNIVIGAAVGFIPPAEATDEDFAATPLLLFLV